HPSVGGDVADDLLGSGSLPGRALRRLRLLAGSPLRFLLPLALFRPSLLALRRCPARRLLGGVTGVARLDHLPPLFQTPGEIRVIEAWPGLEFLQQRLLRR